MLDVATGTDDEKRQNDEVVGAERAEENSRVASTTKVESQNCIPPPPDGGAKAWLQVLGSWCLVFNTWGTIVTFGDYQAFYERGSLFSESSANISWIGSIQSLIVFMVSAVVGPLYDRGHLKLLLAVGAFGIVFGHMMLSLSTQYWQIVLTQGFVVGIGGGCLFVPALAVPQPYFSSRIGLALGIVGTGSSLGSIAYAVIFINLIDRVGFAWTVRVIGFVALAILSLPLMVLQMRTKSTAARKIFDLSAFRDGKFMLCVLGCFLGYAGFQVSIFYLAFFGQSKGWFTGNLALYLQPIINAGSIAGRLLPNWLADHIGPINVVIPGSLLVGIIVLCNLAARNASGVICTAIFSGLFSGLFVTIPPLLFITLTKDKSKLGARMGMAYALIGLSVLPGGPGAGGVLQHDTFGLNWTAAWIYASCLQFGAFVIFCGLRVWQCGYRFQVKV